jgi:alpha-beta hydrolase superfamily lysophospholipase
MRVRTAIILVLTVLAAACGDRRDVSPAAPSSPSRWAPVGWAWGEIDGPGGERVRYGVSAPPNAPQGQVVVAPAVGEPIELYFRTARELNERGLIVWIVEPHQRSASDHVRLAVSSLVRPTRELPVAILSAGDGAVAALEAAAAEDGRIHGVFLWSPTLPETPGGLSRLPGRSASARPGLESLRERLLSTPVVMWGDTSAPFRSLCDDLPNCRAGGRADRFAPQKGGGPSEAWLNAFASLLLGKPPPDV